jgi:hypothetical protein
MAMLGAAGEAGEDEEGRVGVVGRFVAVPISSAVYYVSRTTHDVVISQPARLRKGEFGDQDRIGEQVENGSCVGPELRKKGSPKHAIIG